MNSQDYGVVTATDTVRIERTLPGPIERVWAYLTDPVKRATWLAGGSTDLRPGGAMTLVFHNNTLAAADDVPPPKYEKYGGEITESARVIECEPPRLLSHTWGEGNGASSEVRFELTPHGDKVQLVVTHRRLPNRGETLAVSGGWHVHLDILAARLEGREPPSIWRSLARVEPEYDRRIPRG